MSPLRVAVEQGFGKIAQQFAFVDFRKNLKLFLQPVARYYFVAVLLTNCHTCLYGSAMCSLLGSAKPTLDEYLV